MVHIFCSIALVATPYYAYDNSDLLQMLMYLACYTLQALTINSVSTNKSMAAKNMAVMSLECYEIIMRQLYLRMLQPCQEGQYHLLHLDHHGTL